MNPKRITLFSLCAIALLVALVWPTLPVASEAERLANLPNSGPGFDSEHVPLSAADIKFLNGARADIRQIRLHTGGSLILTVIDGSENRHAVHDPSYCLAGGGWRITDKKRMTTQSGEATWMKMTKDDSTTEAIWFFDDKESQFTSPFTYWARTSARRISLGRSGAEPLLVTLRALPGAPMDWNQIHKTLLPALGFH
jgi:hypothetical protein